MKNNSENNPKETVEKYYDLKTEAIDDLLNAETDETEVSEEELKKYRKSSFHIPDFLKYTLIKLWFAGAVYYFIGFGLGITNLLDQVFVMGIALGMVTDLLTNNVIRFLEETPGANDKWLLFSRKGYMSFFFNMIYGIVMLVAVAGVYWVLEWIADVITSDPDTLHIGTEPVFFGVFCALLDMLLIKLKNLILKLFKRIRK